MNFSFVLIARNEEKTLPRLLKSLDEFKARGGEVVVVDTGSTDKTAQIARDWGCKVEEVGDRFLLSVTEEEAKAINEKFVVGDEEPVVKAGDRQFDFSAARNYATSLASKDFVWSPDCDEVFTKLNLDIVEAAIQGGAEILEYEFVFSHDDVGRPLIRFKHSKAFDRRKFQWTGVVHEVLAGTGKSQYIPESDILLEHFQNAETNRGQYLRGLAIDCYKHPDNDRNSHYFGREMIWNGRLMSGRQELERHIAMGKWPAEASQSAVLIGQSWNWNRGWMNYDKAIHWFHKAIQIDCTRREPWYHLTEIAYIRGEAQRAAAYCEAALTIENSTFYGDNASHYRDYFHKVAYWAYWQLGQKSKANLHWYQAREFEPFEYRYLYDARFFMQLPTVSFVIPTLGRPEGLQKCLDSIKALNYPQELIDVCVLDEPEPTVPQKVKMGVERTKGEYICYAANDVVFTPNSLIIAVLESLRSGNALVSFHSEDILPDEGNICAHFIIRRDFIPEIGGEIFDTEFVHVGVDNLLWAKCSKMGTAHHEKNAVIAHNHFSKGAEFDWVYQRGWANAEKDRELLKKKLTLLA